MARRWKNPLGFYPTSVTLILLVVYIVIAGGLLYVHHTVPSPPRKTPFRGVNVTEAWRDLQILSGSHHPYNSRSNDQVRTWILLRIDEILSRNFRALSDGNSHSISYHRTEQKDEAASAIVLNDLVSNVTYYSKTSPQSVYFEGSNVVVYVRGLQDDDSDWWNQTDSDGPQGKHGVLVNAHYDSVSTSYGATDNGVGVVNLLQLISYYTTKGNQPQRGLVALFNNGEEDFLNGAWAFMQHPISKYPDTFLNLEGAGAGGRATLLRTTDAEVTKSYKKSPYPFGTSISADSFKRGLVRSETDYVVFSGELGMRGLDVAFYEPRARYHTPEDNSRDTSPSSIWHMLSAAVTTTKELTSDTSTDFTSTEGSSAVYFDVFGRSFGLMTLHTLVSICITLLVVAPVSIIVISLILRRSDKSYLFAGKLQTDPLDPHAPDETTTVRFRGWRGFSRYPIAFIIATAAVVGLVFLVVKVNPQIIYSSHYIVWSMLISAWFLVSWSFLRGSDFMRPSALHRAHAFGWICLISWILLLLATIMADRSKVTGAYPFMIYFAGSFAALAICYLEFFGLPTRKQFLTTFGRDETQGGSSTSEANPSNRATEEGTNPGAASGSNRRNDVAAGEDDEPTETTSLLGRKTRSATKRNSRRRDSNDDDAEESGSVKTRRRKLPFGDEQEWSAALPSWLWILELLVFVPVALIFFGPIGLISATSLHQTPADGSSVLPIYMTMALITILLLIPASPFFHRISSRLPTLILLVFIVTLLYSLLAFPFSPQNRLKVFFRQDVDFDTGLNNATLTGLDGYVQKIIADLPSAAGQSIHCEAPPIISRRGLRTCSWRGLAPNVVPEAISSATLATPLPPEKRYESWLKVKATRSKINNETEAKIKISGENTRACRLLFDQPILDFYVNDAGNQSERIKRVSPQGAREIRLWSREWDRRWTVHVKWDGTDNSTTAEKGLDATAVCLWSDWNEIGTIPALDEVRMYMPEWSIVTKLDDGLVSGSKRFLL